MKQQSVTLRVAGLMTDPGPFTATPEGGLVEAQNVVVLRPGVVEPRPGTLSFKDSTLKSGGDSAYAVYADASGGIFAWASSPWVIRKNGSTTIAGPSSFISGKIRIAPTGGRALFTSESGICTLPGQLASPASGSSTVAYRAGMPQPWAPNITQTTGDIPSGASVIYRFTLRRRLADGTVIEGPPSLPVLFTGTGGTNFGVYFSGPSTTDPYQAWRTPDSGTNEFNELIAGDELCIYRSSAVVGTPTDELRLRATLPFNTTYKAFVDPANPPAPWSDRASDSDWSGQELYTNETEEGIGLSNYRPQYARDIALYNGMTFYAGAKSAQQISARLCGINTVAGMGSTGFTVGVTAASTTITGFTIAQTAQLSVGQIVQAAGTSPEAASAAFAARTAIVSVGTTSIVVSNASGVTNAALGIVVWDWVETNDGTNTNRMYFRDTTQPAPTGTGITSFIVNTNTYAAPLAEVAWNGIETFIGATGWSRWREIQLRITPDTGRFGSSLWTFERPLTDDGSFTLKTSKGAAWDRYIDSSTGVTSAQDGGIAELQWSKTAEPEHRPIPYRTTVGDEAYAIRRIVVARNSLLVFKDDGLFQVFGSTPSDLAFELLDRTIIIPAPKDTTAADEPAKWVGRYDDRVFAMTTRGPMEIADVGGQIVGAPILETLRRRFTYAYGAFDETLRALMIDTQSRRVGFFYDVDGTGVSSVGYVLDVDTGTWTYWTFARLFGDFGTLGAFAAPVFAGGYQYGYMLDARTMLGSTTVATAALPNSCEQWPSETCTINTVTGSGPYTVTIAAGSEWTPAVGDLLIRSGVSHQVSAITSATVFATDTQPTTGAATWKEGFEARVVWSARAEGNVATEKTWSSVVMPFELAALTGRMKSYLKGYRNTDAAVESFLNATTQTIGTSPYPLLPRFERWNPAGNRGNDWAVKVGFSIRQACCWFSTAGVSVLYDVAAPDLAGGRR